MTPTHASPSLCLSTPNRTPSMALTLYIALIALGCGLLAVGCLIPGVLAALGAAVLVSSRATAVALVLLGLLGAPLRRRNAQRSTRRTQLERCAATVEDPARL